MVKNKQLSEFGMGKNMVSFVCVIGNEMRNFLDWVWGKKEFSSKNGDSRHISK